MNKKAQESSSISPGLLTAFKAVLAILAVFIFGFLIWRTIAPYWH